MRSAISFLEKAMECLKKVRDDAKNDNSQTVEALLVDCIHVIEAVQAYEKIYESGDVRTTSDAGNDCAVCITRLVSNIEKYHREHSTSGAGVEDALTAAKQAHFNISKEVTIFLSRVKNAAQKIRKFLSNQINFECSVTVNLVNDETALKNRFGALWHADDYKLQTYGLKTALFSIKQLDIQRAHKHSTDYARDSYQGRDELAMSLLNEQEKEVYKKHQLFVVNSLEIAKKISMIFPDSTLSITPIQNTTLYTLRIRSSSYNTERLVVELGGSISIYELYQASHSVTAAKHAINVARDVDPTLLPHPPNDLTKQFDTLKHATQYMKLMRESQNETAAFGCLCKNIINLYAGLSETIENIEKHGTHVEKLIIENILHELDKLFYSMSIADSRNSTRRQSELYDLITEEINMILLYDHQSQKDQYGDLMQKVLKKKKYLTEGINSQSYLTNGAMDSISTAICAAGFPVQFLARDMTYFEITSIYRKSMGANASTLFCTLESSTPDVAPPNIEILASTIKGNANNSANEFVTVILDNTLEGDSARLAHFIALLSDEIKNGKINLILCKSHQKYSSLGTGKVMAGDLTILNNGDEKFSKITKKINEFCFSSELENAEHNRLIKHILKYSADSELTMTKIAAENAMFVKQFCFTYASTAMNDKAKCSEHSPFVLLQSPHKNDQQSCWPFVRYLENAGVAYRDTFSGVLSSSVLVGGSDSFTGVFWYDRINVGLESKERLIEIYYGMGRMYSALIDNYHFDLTDEFQKIIISLNVSESDKWSLNDTLRQKSPTTFFHQIKQIAKKVDDNKNTMNQYAMHTMGSLVSYRLSDQLLRGKIITGSDQVFIHSFLCHFFDTLTPEGKKSIALNYLSQDFSNTNILSDDIFGAIKNCFIQLPPLVQAKFLIETIPHHCDTAQFQKLLNILLKKPSAKSLPLEKLEKLRSMKAPPAYEEVTRPLHPPSYSSLLKTGMFSNNIPKEADASPEERKTTDKKNM